MTATPTGGETSSAPRFAAAIPAYQAEPTIADVVHGTRQILDSVLVVDDGSSDDTGARATEAGARVLTIPRNRGKGHALKCAFEELFGDGVDAVVTLDADGQHLPSEIPALLAEYAKGADLVLGTREHLFERMSPVRSWSNRLSSRAISFAAGKSLSDIQTGFRVYSHRLLERAPFVGNRFEAESAIVVRAARRGMVIRTIPVRMDTPDGRTTSHYRPLVDSFRIAGAVVRARFG